MLLFKWYLFNGNYIFGNFTTWPYTFSEVNKFTVIGCNDYAWLTSRTKSRNISTGCIAFCSRPEDDVRGECSGNGCCQSSIPEDINYYTTELRSLAESGKMSSTRSFNPCTYAFIGEEKMFTFKGATDLNDSSFKQRIEDSVPIVLEWAIGKLSCAEAEKTDGFACKSNSKCVNSTRLTGGYRCMCLEGYDGNPYLSPGCQDINECDDKKNYPCYGKCVNSNGSYTCKCRHGHSGNATIEGGCRRKSFVVLKVSLGMGLPLLVILIGSVCYFIVSKRKLVKLREKFFVQNGGVLLEQKLRAQGGVSSMKIFSFEELEEATGKFAKNRIIGKGGNGIVYKGILSDKREVAIKKSLKVDHRQREQFINEMTILTQVNHRNVVKLLGCCLEIDVPLLVYEFVSNDTLYHHIQDKTSGKRRLSWDIRLRIACESAGALAYLHSAASMPIIHRDVKSSNILLDDSYITKIADFGASRVVPLGHHEVNTFVQGTVGYLDPEYLETGQLTDKSDVYSFGVVLAELVTGTKPLSVERSQEEQKLATCFKKAVKENRLFQILEPQLTEEAAVDQLKAIGDLVRRCLNLVGGDRPSMQEVAMELETLRKIGNHPWASQDSNSEMNSLINESEQTDFYTVPLIPYMDTFGEYGSSGTEIKDMMIQVRCPR